MVVVMGLGFDNFLLLVISFLWGIQPFFSKYARMALSMETIMICGIAVSAACSLLFLDKSNLRKEVSGMSWKVAGAIVMASAVCGWLSNVIYNTVLVRHSVTKVTLLVYTAPLFTVLVAILVGHVITLKMILGAALIVGGVIAVSDEI
jgi:drug/metabolite transporter (DMT)-like permease